MKSFNLSDWALKHRSLVWYFMIAFMMAGLFAYLQLGRQEDPDFTIKTMVIQAQWPGASAEEVTRQVTDQDREEARRVGEPRLHEERNCGGTDDCVCVSPRQYKGQ